MFSWHVTVKETSLRLSKNSSPATSRVGVAAQGTPGQVRYREPREPLSGSPSVGGGAGDQDNAAVDIVRIVVDKTCLLMDFCAEKGFALQGSVRAISASGLGGATLCSMKPANLWGVAEGEGSEGSGEDDCLEGEFKVWHTGGGTAGAVSVRPRW